MSEPRYLEIMSDVGKDGKKDGRGKFVRGTEGDKLRLRREGVDWIDWTGREEMAAAQVKAEPSEFNKIAHGFCYHAKNHLLKPPGPNSRSSANFSPVSSPQSSSSFVDHQHV